MNTLRRSVRRVGTGQRTRRPRLQPVHPRRVRRAGACPSTGATTAGRAGYKTEYDNFAPNVGVAWQPKRDSAAGCGSCSAIRNLATRARELRRRLQQRRTGLLQRCLQRNRGEHGDDDAIGRERAVPLVPAGQRWPVLLRDAGSSRSLAGYSDRARLPDGDQLHQRRQPHRSRVQDAVGPLVSRSGCSGRSAELMVVEVRYVGTRLVDGTSTENWNCAVITPNNAACGARDFTSNGFLDEFRLAQQNLQVAIAQGCGQPGRPACSFAYQGPGTGTNPLPIYLANFNGTPAAQAGDAARYTGTNWTNTRAPRRARRAQSQPRRRDQRALRQRRRSAPTWRRPGCRATSSCSTRM